MKLVNLLSWLVLATFAVLAKENKSQFDFDEHSHYSQFMPPANTSLDGVSSVYNGFIGLPNVMSFRRKRSVAPHHNHRKHSERHATKHNGPNIRHNKGNHMTTPTKHGAKERKKHKKNDDRLSIITRITSCNYANHPGSRCLSCREAITCLSNNRAIVRRCFFILRYCNNGRCSFNRGRKCFRTPTAATASSSSSSSTSTSTTTSTSTSNTTSTITTSTTATSNTTTASNTTSTTPSSTSTTTVSSSTTPTSTVSSSSSSSVSTSSSSSTSPTSTGSSTASSTSTGSSSSSSGTTSTAGSSTTATTT